MKAAHIEFKYDTEGVEKKMKKKLVKTKDNIYKYRWKIEIKDIIVFAIYVLALAVIIGGTMKC